MRFVVVAFGWIRQQLEALLPPGLFTRRSYVGFLTNEWHGPPKDKPKGGKNYLPDLKKAGYDFMGFWLNQPPNTDPDKWQGTRQDVIDADLGMVVIYNPPTPTLEEAKAAGDAADAISKATTAGFAPHTLIYLDVEHVGEQENLYAKVWVEHVNAGSPKFRAGVYCSGDPRDTPPIKPEDPPTTQAKQIRDLLGKTRCEFWVYRSQASPDGVSPGCTIATVPNVKDSGCDFASIWQYCRTPPPDDDGYSDTKLAGYTLEVDPATHQKSYHCYAGSPDFEVDLSCAYSTDPSGGRRKKA